MLRLIPFSHEAALSHTAGIFLLIEYQLHTRPAGEKWQGWGQWTGIESFDPIIGRDQINNWTDNFFSPLNYVQSHLTIKALLSWGCWSLSVSIRWANYGQYSRWGWVMESKCVSLQYFIRSQSRHKRTEHEESSFLFEEAEKSDLSTQQRESPWERRIIRSVVWLGTCSGAFVGWFVFCCDFLDFFSQWQKQN